MPMRPGSWPRTPLTARWPPSFPQSATPCSTMPPAKRAAVWDWLKTQPDNRGHENAEAGHSQLAAWQNRTWR